MRYILLLSLLVFLFGCVYNPATGDVRVVNEEDIEKVADNIEPPELPEPKDKKEGSEDLMNTTPTKEDPENVIEEVDLETRSVEELMADAKSRLKSDFYATDPGAFKETAYSWVRVVGNYSPGAVVFDNAPATDIKVNGEVIDSIRAAVLIAYEMETQTDGRGAILVASESSILNTLTDFEVRYFYSEKHRYFRGCDVFDREDFEHEDGSVGTIYLFRCDRVTSE